MTEPLTIAIDPGKEALAWCLGRGRIEASGLIQGADPKDVPRMLAELAKGFPGLPGWTHAQVWVEFMQHRPGADDARTASAKAKAILDLQFLGGAVAGMLAITTNATVHPVTYHQWSGSAPETQVRNRLIGDGKGVVPTLTPDEICALDVKRYRGGIRHNLYDAAGIFCFATRRLYPGMRRGAP